MVGEAVAGMTHVKRSHQRIARNLHQNRGGSDARGFGVALDYRLLRDRDVFQAFASIKRCCRVTPSPSTARRMARVPAQ